MSFTFALDTAVSRRFYPKCLTLHLRYAFDQFMHGIKPMMWTRQDRSVQYEVFLVLSIYFFYSEVIALLTCVLIMLSFFNSTADLVERHLHNNCRWMDISSVVLWVTGTENNRKRWTNLPHSLFYSNFSQYIRVRRRELDCIRNILMCDCLSAAAVFIIWNPQEASSQRKLKTYRGHLLRIKHVILRG